MESFNTQSKNEKVTPDNKKIFITIGIALLLLIGIWVWKSIEIKNIKSKAESDYQALKEQAIEAIVTSREEQLKLLAKTYVWAVRTEMMRGNINQVNLYALDMIKEKNMMLIAIADDNGMIVSSTNKKNEGNPLTSVGDSTALSYNDTMVKNTGDSILIVTSPIMSFNKRLGTLFIKYAIQRPL